MAEIAGLAFSSVAFTSMITTSIDILEHLDNGRYWIEDIEVALTKVRLLKARLVQIKKDLLSDNRSKPPKKECTEVYRVAEGAMLGIDTVLSRTNELFIRYTRPGPDTIHLDGATNRKMETSFSLTAQKSQPPRKANGTDKNKANFITWRWFAKRVCWVVQDKRRFEHLTSDLDLLVSSTEKIIEILKADTDIYAAEKDCLPRYYLKQDPVPEMDNTPNGIEVGDKEPQDDRGSRSPILPTQDQNLPVVPYKSPPAEQAPKDDTGAQSDRGGRTDAGAQSEVPPKQSAAVDTWNGNTARNKSMIIRGGYISSEGKVAAIPPLNATENHAEKSVLIMGAMVSSDLQTVVGSQSSESGTK